MKKSLFLVAAAVIAASTMAAQAATTFDTNVTTPPGVFFGTGNSNGAFTVETDGGIELGLRGQLSIVSPPTDPVSTNVYDLPQGSQPAQANGIAAKPTRSAWGVTYSINVANATASPQSLQDYLASLTVVDTTTSTTLTTWDVLGNNPAAGIHVLDDTFTNGTGTATHVNGSGNPATYVLLPGDSVAQNSENAAFFPGLNFNSADNYTFTLSLFNNNAGVAGTELASDTIVVDTVATPLPSAAGMGFGMLAVIGAAGVLRKKLRTA